MATSSPPPVAADLDLDRQERWRLSVHEAAHLIAARALAAEAGLPAAPAGAFLVLSGGGLAYVGRPEFSRFETAVSLAAGSASEPIARRHRPPRGELAPLTAEHPPGGISTGAYAGIAADLVGAVSDRELVKIYCTSTNVGPAAWAGRWRAVYATTRRILREHRREILQAARHLFLHGAILPSEVEDILRRSR